MIKIGTINLLKAMKVHGVKNLVFSSSATVYGDVKNFPAHGLTEDLPTQVLKTTYFVLILGYKYLWQN